MNNYLLNIVYKNYFDISKYYLKYSNYLVSDKKLYNKKLYNTIKDDLEENNYLINIDRLINKLKPLNISYSSLYTVPLIIKKVVSIKIIEEVKKCISIYKEFEKIDKSVKQMNKKEDYALNKYYKINEKTNDYILYYIYSKMESFNKRSMLKTFTIILELYDKTIDSIRKNNLEFISKYNTLAYNLFYTLRFNDYDAIYSLRKEESDLKEYSLFNMSSAESKNFYRDKLTHRVDRYTFLKKHKLEDLYKDANIHLSLNSTNYKFKTLIVFNNITKYDDIDKIIEHYDNIDRNFIFYIKTDDIKNSYYINMASDTTSFIEVFDDDYLFKKNVKYVIILNTKTFNINSMYKLINILQHPNNNPYKTDKKYKGIIELKFKYNKVYSYIYNLVFKDKYFKNTNYNDLPYKKYKLKDDLYFKKNDVNSLILKSDSMKLMYYNDIALYSSFKILSNLKLIFKIDDKYIDTNNFNSYIEGNIIYMNYDSIGVKISLIKDSLVINTVGAKSFYIYFATQYDNVSLNDNKVKFTINNNIFYIYGDKIDKIYTNKYNVYNKNTFDINTEDYKEIEKCICFKTNSKNNIIISRKPNTLIREKDFINIKEEYNNSKYNKLIYYIYNPVYDNYKSSLLNYNSLNINYLNKYDLSINEPFIIIDSFKESLLEDIFNFYKYIKLKNINIKLLFIYDSMNDKNNLDKYLYLYKDSNILKSINKKSLKVSELTLLYLGSVYNISTNNVDEFIDSLNINKDKIGYIKSDEINEKLDFTCKCGGFKDKELVIKNYDRNLPINKLISNNMVSITSPIYSYTMYKDSYLTKKDNLYNESSEWIIVEGKKLVYDSFIIRDGITKRIFKKGSTKVEVVEALSIIDDVKMFKVNIKSKGNKSVSVGLHLDINNLYGRYHYTSLKDNIVKINNGNNLFVACTNTISDFKDDTIYTNIKIKKDEAEVTFTFGAVKDEKDIWFLKEKYSNITTIDTSIKILENDLKNTYHKLNLYSSSNKLNFLFNKILPYNLYINENSYFNLSFVCNIFKENALKKIKEYNFNLEYICLLYKYIYYFEDYSLINNDIYKSLENILLNTTERGYIYSCAIDSFIGLTKMIYKRKSVKKYETLKENVKKDKTHIYKFITDADASFIRLFKKDEVISFKNDDYVIENSEIYYYAILRYLGINIENDKLSINNPLIKRKYSFNYKYFNSNYFVTVKFSKKESITLDGIELKTKYVKLTNDLKKHEIIIEKKKEE